MTENNGEENSTQSTDPNRMKIAWLLTGGGALATVYLLIKKDRHILSWIISIGMMAIGIDVLLKDREEQIRLTGDQIITELDQLDPVARAEVVKYIVDKRLDRK